MASEAQQLIAVLQSRGWSYRGIGQALGDRDRSLIRQGALGKKPLHNLVPGLQQLVEHGKPGSARLTEYIDLPRLGERRTLGGGQQYERVVSSSQAKDYLAAVPAGNHVQISYRGKDGSYHLLGRKGGYRADLLQQRMRGPKGGQRTFGSVVAGIIGAVYGDGAGFEAVGAFELISVK